MLDPLPQDAAKRFKEFLASTGFSDAARVEAHLLTETSLPQARRLPRLRALTAEETPFNLLARLLLLGDSVPAEAARRCFPDWFREAAQRAGFLREEGASFTAPYRVRPYRNLLVVADQFRQLLGEGAADHVLTVNPAAILLLESTIRRPFRTALDLGCGNGIQALVAAAHCGQVVATDINPRAVRFTALNAQMNGIGNIECLAGDLFAPVAGRTFDLIVTNPPFILGPSEGLVYASSSSEPLDAFCRRLTREAPPFLADGGILQMVCEWAEVEGEPWSERLTKWFEGLGCDAWVMPHYHQSPETYTQMKMVDAPWHSEDSDSDFFARWMGFFRAHRVTAMHGGLIALRRREGRNWMKFMTYADRPRGAFGDAVWRGFQNRDFLESHPADADLLAARLKLVETVRLVAAHRSEGGTWGLDSVRLVLPECFSSEFPLRPEAAEFAGRFDGAATLADLARGLSARAGAPFEAVVPEVCALARELLERGYLEPVS